MKLKYKQKIFFSFLFIFLLFTTGIVLFERSQERKYKTEILEEKLDAYTNMVDAVLRRYHTIDSLLPLLPSNMRLTLIDKQGVVVFDNVMGEIQMIENHADRPEIKMARNHQKGSHIRVSHSNQQKYLYYAKRFGEQYIRVALPYDIQLRDFLKSNSLFLYYTIVLFVLTLFLLRYASNIFGKSIKKLKNFTDAAEHQEVAKLKMDFPEDELGEIGKKIACNYQQLEESKKSIILEREKLLQHVYTSEEGICFFSADRKVEFYNGLFMQYLNIIMPEFNHDPVAIFSDIHFEKINSYLSQQEKNDSSISPANHRYFETKIERQGKTLMARVNIFENNSFEVILNDITKQEKTRLLKQEMTGNITHELRTPVTSIRGCLETILQHSLDSEKQHYFIQNAYNQTLMLSELIQDLGLLTQIEDAPRSFSTEEVNLPKLIEGLEKDLEYALKEKNMKIEWDISENTMVIGNKNLLYAIFRNLTDNAIRYAGSNVTIQIKQYNQDKDYYYFSFADNGTGISEEHHLNRLFERFYRINEGRTRDTGGSGLGLSIVKNAILFHHGTILVKNRPTGGLEFLFTLKK